MSFDNRLKVLPKNQEFELNLFWGVQRPNALGVIYLHGITELRQKYSVCFYSFQSVRETGITGEVNGIAVYDDFAHHPTAIREKVCDQAKKSRTPLDYRF
ncbi:MAG: hypothetical protein Ct9H300mP21_02650 [Pseudomonadota bacterium]|nr:MAG: hypothetical protein Ct9H300mP21_02650 [Pseudomonadota bacterium]